MISISRIAKINKPGDSRWPSSYPQSLEGTSNLWNQHLTIPKRSQRIVRKMSSAGFFLNEMVPQFQQACVIFQRNAEVFYMGSKPKMPGSLMKPTVCTANLMSNCPVVTTPPWRGFQTSMQVPLRELNFNITLHKLQTHLQDLQRRIDLTNKISLYLVSTNSARQLVHDHPGGSWMLITISTAQLLVYKNLANLTSGPLDSFDPCELHLDRWL